jgi:HK97 family phage major capsid protein
MATLKEEMKNAGDLHDNKIVDQIVELTDAFQHSTDVLGKDMKALETKVSKERSDLVGEVERFKTEAAAGMKVLEERITHLAKRQIAIGPSLQDREAKMLAAIPDSDRKMVHLAEQQMDPARDKGRFASPEYKAAAMLWFWKSAQVQCSRLGGNRRGLQDELEKLEKAFAEVYGQEKAAFAEGAAGTGGSWIPDPVAADVYRLIADNSVMSPLVTHIPMTSQFLDLPTEGTTMTVTVGAENTAITDSVPASPVAKVLLTALRFNGYATASIESLQDSAASILTWVQQKLAELIGTELDRQLLEGTGGASSFTGLSTDAGVNAIAAGTNGDAITYAKLASIPYFALQRASRQGAQWFLSPAAMGKVVGLVDSQGMPIFQFSNVPNAVASSILGYPAQVHSVILANRTKGTGTALTNIYFGPPKSIVLGDKMGMSWDVSEAPGFASASVAMRLLMRAGGAVAVPKAFTNAKDLGPTT